MKRTDEMKFGESLRAPDSSPERLLANVEELTARINAAPDSLDRGEYWCEVAMRRGKQLTDQWFKLDALNVRLRVMQGVALVGWAAFILELLRV